MPLICKLIVPELYRNVTINLDFTTICITVMVFETEYADRIAPSAAGRIINKPAAA
jgi:hypothetical protein